MSRLDKAAIRNELSQSHGIDFSQDFHELNSSKVEGLMDSAKQYGYRKPANANGSTGRSFFEYLNRGKDKQ